MKVLVLSDTHSLLPFAYRLKREGADIQVWVAKRRFRPAWAGRLEQFPLPDKLGEHEVGVVKELLTDTGITVLSDNLWWDGKLKGLPGYFGMHSPSDPPKRAFSVGAWWDGENFLGVHVLFTDWGAQAGGLGPGLPGGVTLARPQPAWPPLLTSALEEIRDSVKSSGFRGLLSVGLWANTETQEWAVDPWQGGWLPLHTHAFLSRLESFSDVLLGQEPQIPDRYQVVLPVTLPPWPTLCNVSAPVVPILGLTKDELSSVFFHDVNIGDDSLSTAGTDGLVCVVRGYANNLSLARSRAVTLAAKMVLTEKQYRPDVGSAADFQLAALEELGVTL